MDTLLIITASTLSNGWIVLWTNKAPQGFIRETDFGKSYKSAALAIGTIKRRARSAWGSAAFAVFNVAQHGQNPAFIIFTGTEEDGQNALNEAMCAK